MTSPRKEEGGPLKEWAPLTALLQKLPAKLQNGLFAQDVNFTCIDVVAEFIALGTNHGFVYWFDRKIGKLETLACENSNTSITCVKIVSTVEYMIAAGDDNCVVTIFQIPKFIPDSLPESLKPKKKQQVERFSVGGVHKVPITAVEWSKNGMKLFSGDKEGVVVLTEIDYYMHLSKSTELLNEKYTVVQLNYQNQRLLISTVFRTIVVIFNKNLNNQVKQIGQKERKMLGKFGAVFSNKKNYVDPPVIYAARPGLRIWQADDTGTVSKTLIFKELLKTEQTKVELLNPITNKKKLNKVDANFGLLKSFSDNLLITFNENIIYILNPYEITIHNIITDLRKVTDLACYEDEIFIIEGERNVLRLSCFPEIDILETVSEQNTLMAESSKSWNISDTTSKLKPNQIFPAIPFPKINPVNLSSIIPPIVIGLDTTSIVNAEEAIEVPPIVPLNLDTLLVTNIETLAKNNHSYNKNITNRKGIFKKISEQDFEDVVFTPKRRNKNSSSKVTSNINTKDTELNFVTDNIECIKKAVEDKEKVLSNYLDLDLSKYKDKSEIYQRNSNESENINDSLANKNESLQNFISNTNHCDKNFESIVDDKTKAECQFNELSKKFVESKIQDCDWTWLG